MLNIHWFQLLKFDTLLFTVLYLCKMNAFGFWMLIRRNGTLEDVTSESQKLYFSVFSDILLT